jgi:hypothetical protein
MSTANQQFFLPQDRITVLNKSSRRSDSRKGIPQNTYYEPNWNQKNSRSPSNYERLAKGRYNFDKWTIKPQESRSRPSYEVEDAFINGTNRVISRHGDRNWKPLARRTPLLIDRELLPIN